MRTIRLVDLIFVVFLVSIIISGYYAAVASSAAGDVSFQRPRIYQMADVTRTSSPLLGVAMEMAPGE